MCLHKSFDIASIEVPTQYLCDRCRMASTPRRPASFVVTEGVFFALARSRVTGSETNPQRPTSPHRATSPQPGYRLRISPPLHSRLPSSASSGLPTDHTLSSTYTKYTFTTKPLRTFCTSPRKRAFAFKTPYGTQVAVNNPVLDVNTTPSRNNVLSPKVKTGVSPDSVFRETYPSVVLRMRKGCGAFAEVARKSMSTR